MIAIVEVRPTADDKRFLANSMVRFWTMYMKNGCLADPDYFETELPSLYEDIKTLQNHQGDVFRRRYAPYRREAPTGRLKKLTLSIEKS
jgi:hypothetical protein